MREGRSSEGQNQSRKRAGRGGPPVREPELDQVAVTDAKFYWVEDPYLPFPVIEFAATNRSTSTLAKLYLRGTLALTPGALPCVDQNFCVFNPAGIPAGESRRMVLLPSVLTAWGDPQTQYHGDVRFSLTVLNAARPDGTLLRDQPDTDALSELPILSPASTESTPAAAPAPR
jgi:hypothetical protein